MKYFAQSIGFISSIKMSIRFMMFLNVVWYGLTSLNFIDPKRVLLVIFVISET